MGMTKKQRDKIWGDIPCSFTKEVLIKLPWTKDESCNMDYKTEIDTYKYVSR
ncbi:hypothetical protein [Leyella stercorea]|jgi:hypothetical protein|uniref:hypothetical protein n=1 Tax=Leyella stercorea TaxID=363265 RepID=UPI00266CB5E8|nr:hypothetical protein [Leyella stercorea]